MGDQHIADELNKVLGPEFINYKNTGGSREPYIEGWAAIEIANRLFGHNGWSTDIKQMDIIDVEEAGGRFTITARSHIRITLKDGTYREDIGFGSADNIKGKGRAIKQCQKSSITDGIKRALRQFGSALGNCCYDLRYRKYIQGVSVKRTPLLTEADLIRPGGFKRLDGAAPSKELQLSSIAKPSPAVSKEGLRTDKTTAVHVSTKPPTTSASLKTPTTSAPLKTPSSSKLPQLADLSSSQDL
ncbi:DNA repair and recombination protein RAD52 [Nematocida sp. AWRm77]|nr:DNA repair and recombination protein RAD52 [Nematocida sp. AWRm77]